MDVLLTLAVWFLCGFGCYKMAENQGRDKTLGAVLGVLFGVFAISDTLSLVQRKSKKGVYTVDA